MTIATRTLRHTIRVPGLLAFLLVQPVVFTLLFRYVFSGAIHVGRGVPYVNFLMAGVFVQTVAFGATTPTGMGIAEDLCKGFMDRFRTLPMAQAALLLGRTLADLVRNTAIVIVMVITGLAVGFRPSGTPLDWLAAAGLLLVFSFSFSWVGMAIGLGARNPEAVQAAGLIWLFPFTFASSAFVPISTMPGWMQVFANNQPITKVVNAERDWMLGQPVGANAWVALVFCAGVLVVAVPLALRFYRRAAALN